MKHLVESAGLSERFFIDSAGTGAYHVGEPADIRSAKAALSQGITLTSISRQFTDQDFSAFDYVIAMDSKNQAHLLRMAETPEARKKVALLRSFEPEAALLDVPDPYFQDNFDGVFQICHAGCKGLLAHIMRERGITP